MKVLHVKALDWGNGERPFSVLRAQVCNDPRFVYFEGDAYWQWAETPKRNKGKNFCWSQALHDAMEGWHACVLHVDDTVSIMPHHPDFKRVERLFELAQLEDGAQYAIAEWK